MSDLTPEDRRDKDLEERYRRASSFDQNRPDERVRRAVLEHAAVWAARRARPRRSWWPLAAGTLAAAALAGLVIAPHGPPAPSPEAPAAPAASLSTAPQAAAADLESAAAPAAPEPSPSRRASIARQGATESRSQPVTAPAPSDSPQPVRQRMADVQAPTPLMRASPPPAAPAPARAGLAPQAAGADLRQAAARGDLEGLQQRLAASPGDLESRDDAGRTALMLATVNGHSAVVAELLSHGADPNATDARGVTPLQAATDGNQPDIAQALKAAGAR